ncbi:hypothetical protein K466DRAFT_204125 [Polyporus arcularius HHB13444]|uniref:Secreted protein n=1 Tax=Polyporus arcularius HHB13444 TaxID=1314778 RepID=A0A5C3P9Y2_9APHY|nr:hypothetical protein K466DRAFT_204125 [Polyporus arcularius HHB13444]
MDMLTILMLWTSSLLPITTGIRSEHSEVARLAAAPSRGSAPFSSIAPHADGLHWHTPQLIFSTFLSYTESHDEIWWGRCLCAESQCRNVIRGQIILDCGCGRRVSGAILGDTESLWLTAKYISQSF